MEAQAIYKRRLRIFGCGGAGTNMLRKYMAEAFDYEGIEVLPTYIDTSRSNLPAGVDPSICYLYEGVDGSGKVRRENYEKISASIGDILVRHPAGDLNIVLSSASGGSGSIIGSEIATALYEREQNVVVILVGSIASNIEAENTKKTLLTYAGIADSTGVPVVMSYHQNDNQSPPSMVDDLVNGDLVLLTALIGISAFDSGLDSADMTHWLNFSKTTGNPAQLASLRIVTNNADFSEMVTANGTPISVATVADGHDNTVFAEPVEYQCCAIIPPADAFRQMAEMSPVHYVIGDGQFKRIYDQIDAITSSLEEKRQARLNSRQILKPGSGSKGPVL